MNSIAMMVVLGATSGLFGGGRQVATTTCTTGTCQPAYTYQAAPVAQHYTQAVAPVAATTCTAGTCPTPAAPGVAAYSSAYYAPQQVQAAVAPAAVAATQAAPTYYAPAQPVATAAQYTRYYYPTTTAYPTWSGSCPNGNCATVR